MAEKKTTTKKVVKKEEDKTLKKVEKEEPRKEFVPKNGKLPGWAIALIVVFSVLIMGAYILFFALMIVFAINDVNNEISEEINQENLTYSLTVDKITKHYYSEEDEAYVLEGYITNITDDDYYDIEIKYNLYDQENGLVGTAIGYVDKIREGEKWKFKAISTDADTKDVTHYSLISIFGYDDPYRFDNLDELPSISSESKVNNESY